jgi:hypothetical protein
MALQQQTLVTLAIQGDGSSTVFTFGMQQIFGFEGQGAEYVNLLQIPSSVTLLADPSIPAGSVASLDALGNLVITFASPIANGAQGTCNMLFSFNSGNVDSNAVTWTSSTGVSATTQISIAGMSTTTVAIQMTGSVTGGVIAFQVSTDGVNWFQVQGASPSGFGVNTLWGPAVGNIVMQFNVTGFNYFRTELTSILVGTGSVEIVQQVGTLSIANLVTVGQPFGQYNHTTLDDSAGGNAVNTVVKGTQGARALTTQDIKDSGRSYLTLTATAAAGVTAETLFSLSENRAGMVTAAVTSYTITSGKTLRITAMTLSVRAGAAAVPFSRATLRSNTAGATTATSSIVFQLPEVFGIAATTGVGGQVAIDIPDGLEIAGNGTITIGISHLDQATTNIINFTLCGYEY